MLEINSFAGKDNVQNYTRDKAMMPQFCQLRS